MTLNIFSFVMRHMLVYTLSACRGTTAFFVSVGHLNLFNIFHKQWKHMILSTTKSDLAFRRKIHRNYRPVVFREFSYIVIIYLTHFIHEVLGKTFRINRKIGTVFCKNIHRNTCVALLTKWTFHSIIFFIALFYAIRVVCWNNEIIRFQFVYKLYNEPMIFPIAMGRKFWNISK